LGLGGIIDHFLATYRSFGLKGPDLVEGLRFFAANPSRVNMYVGEEERRERRRKIRSREKGKGGKEGVEIGKKKRR
jgi:hypothetical protein